MMRVPVRKGCHLHITVTVGVLLGRGEILCGPRNQDGRESRGWRGGEVKRWRGGEVERRRGVCFLLLEVLMMSRKGGVADDVSHSIDSFSFPFPVGESTVKAPEA